ncbi:HD domain-containing protein [Candidatus Poribacteria bacterium]
MERFDNIIRSLEKLVGKELSNWPTEWTGFNWPGYTYEHTLRVRNLSVAMARQLGADERIVELAALLHDIGRPEDGKHSDTGARRAEKVLSELGIDAPTRQRVCHIIETHLDKDPKYPVENLVLYDADFIDANYGYVAFTRYITIRASRNMTVEETMEGAPELLAAFEAKRGQVFTEIGDAISIERFGRMRSFLDSLLQDGNCGAINIARYIAADAHSPSLIRQVEQMDGVLSGSSTISGLESSDFLSEFVKMLKEEIAGER